MITSFEVGSVFTIVDKASPVIARLAKGVGDLGKLVATTKADLKALNDQSFGNLSRNLKLVTDRVATLSGAVDKVAGTLTASTDAATVSVRALATELSAAAAAARALGGASRSMPLLGGPAVGGGGGGGRGRGPIFRRGIGPGSGSFHLRARAHLPGGMHLYGGGAGMIAGAALGIGIYEEAEAQQEAFRGAVTSSPNLSGDELSRRQVQLRNAIASAAAQTGLSPQIIGEAALHEMQQLTGTTWDQKMAMLPSLLGYAYQESQLKGVSIDQAADSYIQMAHQLRAYTPEAMEAMFPKFAALSTMTSMPLPSMVKTFGYSSILQEAGIDPFQYMLLGTGMMRAGVTNTRSGTWLRSFGEGILPGSNAYKKHRSDLVKLGLYDEKGNPTFFKNGHADLYEALKILEAHLQQIPEADRVNFLRNMFGERGSGAASILADPRTMQQLPFMSELMYGFPTRQKYMQENIEHNPMMAFYQTWGELRDTLMDIGRVALPPVVGGLKELDSWLKALKDHWPDMLKPKSPRAQGVMHGAVGGAIAGGIAGFLTPIPGGMIGGALIGGGLGALYGGASAMGGMPHFTTDDVQKALKGTDDNTEATKKNTTSLDDLTRALSLQQMGYYGPSFDGGGGRVIPAMYTTSGGGGYGSGVRGGVASAPSFGDDGVASNPVSSVGRVGGGTLIPPNFTINGIHSALSTGGQAFGTHPTLLAPHFTTADIQRRLGLGSVAGSANAGALSPMGNISNPFIAKQRARFAQELKDPNVRMQVLGMLQAEGTPLQSAESLFNRSEYSHKSLVQMLHSGFYGPINKGMLPRFMAQVRNNPKQMAKLNAAIDAALAGSDTIKGSTDQGMVSDPNGPYILRHFHIMGKGNIFGDWGGGPGGHEGAARWREEFERGAVGTHNDDIGNTEIPPTSSNEVHLHHTTTLDGRVVAKNSMKHMVKMGQGRMSGPRLADYQATRPAEV